MLRLKDQSWKTMLQLPDRFVLNPAYSSKVEVTPPADDNDEFEVFLNTLEPK